MQILFKNKLIFIKCFFILIFFTSSCGIYKPVDSRKVPINADERAKKNVREGKGITLSGLRGGSATRYEFSTSNPMWRASLETLDFLPFSTVDYSGGIIITDWYNDTSSDNDSIKLTLRFLSNDIASDSIKVIVHKKSCKQNNCKVNKIDSQISDEVIKTILYKAAIFEKESKDKKKKN